MSKEHKTFIALAGLSLFAFSCIDRGGDPIASMQDELSDILKQDFFEPPGFLAYTDFFAHGSEELATRSIHLYDIQHREIVRLGVKPTGDTVSVIHFKYNEENELIERDSYYRQENGLQLMSQRLYAFNPTKTLQTVYSKYPEEEPRFIYQLVFDDYGNVLEKQYNPSGYGEKVVYAYEEGLISSMRWLYKDSGPVIVGHLYRYDDQGNLLAKEFFRTFDPPQEGEGNAEEYEYGKGNKMKEMREYDPFWGFPLVRKWRYYYFK